MTTPLLLIEHLSFAYAGEPALIEDWSAQLAPGVSLLFGDTGSGKSTVLRVLAGLQPARGGLTLAGIALDADAAAYRRAVCWFDPATDAFDQVVVRELLNSLCGGDTDWQAHADGFSLDPHLHKPLYMLSTGSRRKVWLAAALASRCALTLLDEPTGALDARSIAHLMDTLTLLAAQRERAVLIASAERPEGIAFAAVIELPLQRGATLTR